MCLCVRTYRFLANGIYIYIHINSEPVVPHEAVAEVSRIGNV